MNRNARTATLPLVPRVFVWAILLAPTVASAGPGYRIDRFTIDSGGGRSTGGDLVLHGTIAQYDAGEFAGDDGIDTLVLIGGFWPEKCQAGECTPTIETIDIDGEIWTDPTNDGTQAAPTVTLTGNGLVPTLVSLSTVHYTREITNYQSDKDGGMLSFELPPFPPGPVLNGAFDVTLTIANEFAGVEVPIRYNVLRRTVDQEGAGDYSTIAAAIAAARPGWAIVIVPNPAPFVLDDTINLGTLHSITMGGETGAANPNIRLDGNTLNVLEIAGSGKDRSVRIQSLDLAGGDNAVLVAAGANPVIINVRVTTSQRGIRITDGADALVRDCRFANTSTVAVDGNAISVTDGATATIISSSMEFNSGADRGTIYLENTSTPVLIVDNSIRLNSADDGGGIFIGQSASARVFNNIIEDNTADFTQDGGHGGGIYIDTQPDQPAPLIEIAHNRIENNHTVGDGVCTVGVRGGGGGLFIADAAPKIVDNVIRGNSASVGGAVAVCQDGNPLFQRNRFLCNTVASFINPAFFGAGIYAVSAEPIILNNVFFQNDLIDSPLPPNNPQTGAFHGSAIVAFGSVLANNIFDDNYGWGMYLDSPGSPGAVDILFNDLWMNDEQALGGLCPLCNVDHNDECCDGAPFDFCTHPGRAVCNIAEDPEFAAITPICSEAEDFLLGAGSALLDGGLEFDAQTFVTAPYVLYHTQLPVNIGYIEQDGVLSPAGPAVSEAREVASHSAIHGDSDETVPVRIRTSPLVNDLDGVFFTFAAGIPGQRATLAMKYDFMGASPNITNGALELPWIPEYTAGVSIQLVAVSGGGTMFDTVLDHFGEIDLEQGTVRFLDVDVTSLEDMWLIGVSAGAPACPADLNLDETVNVLDLAAVLGEWGPCAGCSPDLINDNKINTADLSVVLSTWGVCP